MGSIPARVAYEVYFTETQKALSVQCYTHKSIMLTIFNLLSHIIALIVQITNSSVGRSPTHFEAKCRNFKSTPDRNFKLQSKTTNVLVAPFGSALILSPQTPGV